MLPLRSEVGLSAPGLHPCGHLSYAVHPLLLTMTLSLRRQWICPPPAFSPKKKTPKRPGESKYQRLLLLSRLQTLRVWARDISKLRLRYWWCIAAEGGRANASERVREFASHYQDGSAPQAGGNHHHHHHVSCRRHPPTRMSVFPATFISAQVWQAF